MSGGALPGTRRPRSVTNNHALLTTLRTEMQITESEVEGLFSITTLKGDVSHITECNGSAPRSLPPVGTHCNGSAPMRIPQLTQKD
jgi:hypothetical protein